MDTHVLVVSCAVVVGWASVPQLHAAPPPSTQPAVAPELADLRPRLIEVIDNLYVPGLAVAVVRGDEVIFLDAVGIRDPERMLPVTVDTVFYIASCTKTFGAFAVSKLVEEGKLTLDDPVKKHLPRFKLADPGYTESLTVRDLLSHANGLSSAPIVWLDAYTGQITEARYYRWLERAKPDGSHGYSNVHFTLAGRVIEAVSGQSWKDFLQQHIFDPAGMTRTTCYASAMYALQDVAIPCIRDDGAFKAASVRKADSTMHAAGGMGASARDLARWLRLNLNKGTIDGTRLLSQHGAAEMQRLQAADHQAYPPIIDRTAEGHGLGWAIGTYRKQRYLEHGGGYNGAAVSISFMPELGIGVAVLANADGASADLVTMEIYDRLLGAEGQDLLPMFRGFIEQRLERVRRDAADFGPNPAVGQGLSLRPEAYVGHYDHEDWGTYRIELAAGRLGGSLGELRLELGSTGPDRFTIAYGSDWRTSGSTTEPDDGRFETGPDGRVTALLVKTEDLDQEVRYVRREPAISD